MDARTRLALGGAAVIAVSVSVVASVIATSAVALADAPGARIGAHAVRLPAPSTTPASAPVAGGSGSVVDTPTAAASAPPVTETVPAPAPVVVAPTQTIAAAPPVAVEDEILATGSFDAVHEWAAEHGWSAGQVDEWISTFSSTHELTRSSDVLAPEMSHKTPQTPASAGLSDTEATTPGDGSKKNRSHGTPDPRD
ncbi:hypothetical protein [Microbacterium sp.]|uniref:hypothetical protein n=1 Tax=Microbacterium sp. TaxID=51671 RepID=UPI003F71FD15